MRLPLTRVVSCRSLFPGSHQPLGKVCIFSTDSVVLLWKPHKPHQAPLNLNIPASQISTVRTVDEVSTLVMYEDSSGIVTSGTQRCFTFPRMMELSVGKCGQIFFSHEHGIFLKIPSSPMLSISIPTRKYFSELERCMQHTREPDMDNPSSVPYNNPETDPPSMLLCVSPTCSTYLLMGGNKTLSLWTFDSTSFEYNATQLLHFDGQLTHLIHGKDNREIILCVSQQDCSLLLIYQFCQDALKVREVERISMNFERIVKISLGSEILVKLIGNVVLSISQVTEMASGLLLIWESQNYNLLSATPANAVWTLHPNLNLILQHVNKTTELEVVDRFGQLVRRIDLADYFPEFDPDTPLFVQALVVSSLSIYFSVCGWGKLGMLTFQSLQDFVQNKK